MFVNKKDKIHLDHCWIVDLITSRQIDLLGLVVGQARLDSRASGFERSTRSAGPARFS